MKPILYVLSLFTLLALSCAADATTEETSTTEAVPTSSMTANKQLRHVVLFSFKESSTAEDIAGVEAAFAALPAKIPQIRGFEWGTNNSPEGLDQGFTHCFFLTFDSEEDRAAYLPHPDHKAFGAALGPHLEKVLVVDYWAQE